METTMEGSQIPTMLKWARILFFVNAFVWLIFGILSLLLRAIDGGSLARWVITLLMLINSLVMIGFGVVIVSGRSWIFTLAVVYLALNLVLSITDQFGWIDVFIFFLNLCLLGSLFVARYRMNQNLEVFSKEQ